MSLNLLFLLGNLVFFTLFTTSTSLAIAEDNKNDVEKNSSQNTKISSSQLKSLLSILKKNNLKPSPTADKDMEIRLKSMLSKTPIGSLVNEYPKLLSFFARVMRSPDVSDGLIEIMTQPNLMKNYRYTALGFLVLGFIFNFVGKKNQNWFKRLGKKIFIFIFFFFAQLGSFVFFFPRPSHAIFGIFKDVFIN